MELAGHLIVYVTLSVGMSYVTLMMSLPYLNGRPDLNVELAEALSWGLCTTLGVLCHVAAWTGVQFSKRRCECKNPPWEISCFRQTCI